MTQFNFSTDFQASLVKLLADDSGFSHQIAKHLKPEYFSDQVLSWAFSQAEEHSEQYGGFPSMYVLQDKAARMDPSVKDIYVAGVERIRNASMADEGWLRDQVVDFAKRNIFTEAFRASRELFNNGKTEEAYARTMEAVDEVLSTSWDAPDREWFFAELPRRQSDRWKSDFVGQAITTGMPSIDHVLDGGLSIGELGIWIAYAKHGKSAMLVNMGLAATSLAHKRVAHFVFEGSRTEVSNRYDAAFSDEFYSKVKRGDMDDLRYSRVLDQYRQMSQKLVIQGFVEEWDYSVVDVHNAVKDLKRSHGWTPDLIIVDYGDLLRGRAKHYNNETEKQKAAFQDLKSLANRGYAVWTASQAQRPKENAEVTPHLINSRHIADAYAKVRVADFIGSINMTVAERQAGVLRAYCELYRANAAEKTTVLKADLSKMIIKEVPGVESPHGTAGMGVVSTPQLGYTQVPTQYVQSTAGL